MIGEDERKAFTPIETKKKRAVTSDDRRENPNFQEKDRSGNRDGKA